MNDTHGPGDPVLFHRLTHNFFSHGELDESQKP